MLIQKTWMSEFVKSKKKGKPPISPKPVSVPIQQPETSTSIFTGDKAY